MKRGGQSTDVQTKHTLLWCVCAGVSCTAIIISSTFEVVGPLGDKNEPRHAESWEG